MATKTADPAQDQGQGEGQGGGKQAPADDKTPTMADVRREIGEEIKAAIAPIQEMIAKITPGGGGAGGSDPKAQPAQGDGTAPNLAQMVDDALAKVLGARDAQAKDDAHAQQHAALAAAAETRPVDRPRRSKWLGNIWDK